MPTLDQRVAELETQLANLKRGTLALAPHQMGPRPGEASAVTLRASRILPPNYTGAYMEIDLTQVPSNNTMGSSPAIHVNDGTQERVQMGNLPAYTDPRGVTSPAGYGFRVMDSSGNILFDSIGISVVFTNIATASLAYGVTNFTGANGPPNGVAGFGAEIAVLTTTFTLTRTSSVLLMSQLMGQVNNNSGGAMADQAPIYLRVTGQANSTIGAVAKNRTTDTQGISDTSTGPYQVLLNLPAATYTLNLYWNSLNGASDTLAVRAAQMDVFRMGG